MAHRGPDGAGIWRSADRRCTLGHRRLSIIDLSDRAAQPMLNAAGTVALTFNGEIYNHARDSQANSRRSASTSGRPITRTPKCCCTPTRNGASTAFEKFYGMFALGIYDAREPDRPVVHLIRDRVGIKPMYFTRTSSGEWLFASEIRALLAHPDVTAEMDRTAFWHYLTFIVTPAPLTMFRGIFKLPAGHIAHHRSPRRGDRARSTGIARRIVAAR